jgi:hypothetical protein
MPFLSGHFVLHHAQSCVYVRVFSLYYTIYVRVFSLLYICCWCQVKKAGTLISTLRSWRGILLRLMSPDISWKKVVTLGVEDRESPRRYICLARKNGLVNELI